jgi:hypothetical protein
MNVRDQLLALQWSQLKHDEAYHKDVVILSLAERIKHMALHNAKYTGHFIDAIDTGDDARLAQRLADAFIITLASANTLNQDLGYELGVIGEAESMHQAGERLVDVLPREASDPLWIVRQFARHNGQLANICESWDHLEAMPFREGMKACNLALHQAVLADCAGRDIDISAAYKSRIRVVETRSIFDKLLREGAGGEA